jgi:hypothetical protein
MYSQGSDQVLLTRRRSKKSCRQISGEWCARGRKRGVWGEFTVSGGTWEGEREGEEERGKAHGDVGLDFSGIKRDNSG